MSKSSRPSLFRSRSRGVPMVDVSVSTTASRRALLAFWVLTVAGLAAGGAVGLFDEGQPFLTVLAGGLVGAVCGLLVGASVRAWSVLRVLWHWALEALTVAVLVLGWLALADATSSAVAWITLACLAAAVAAVGPVRRRVVTVTWCAVVRHRLRLCFAEFVRTPGKSAAAPLILAARPTPAGERVWVWLRPGLDLSDLDGKTGKLAVACWASEVRVVRASRRFAALIRIDVARRDPLTGRVSSPLAGLVPSDFTTAAPVSPGEVPAGLDLPDIPDVDDIAPPTPGRSDRPARPGRGKATEPVAHEYDAFI